MQFNIGNFEVGRKRTFVIAEIGNNHNGSITLAKKLVDDAVEIGADCAKFQMRNLDSVYRSQSLAKEGEDLGSEYIIDLLNKYELSANNHIEIAEYCKQKNILYMCTPWDEKSVSTLEDLGVKSYKVASADLTNVMLLKRLIGTQKPIILSTGMSNVEEITKTVDFLNNHNATFALLHCNSTYPAPFSDINLNWIKSLKDIHPIIGYSGHERGISVSIAAVGLGAQIIERHLTSDRLMEGPDHAASLEPQEFKKLIDGIREVEAALGDGQERSLSQGEMINRENLGKSLVAKIDIPSGTTLTEDHFIARSPGSGISPIKIDQFLGKKLTKSIDKEQYFAFSHIGLTTNGPKKYSFNRAYGIPVRYHDFKKFNEKIGLPLVEFHLSYSDMDLDPSDFLSIQENQQLLVHAPELFQGSHLMDLASPDREYREISIRETQRVIDITRSLNKFFPSTVNPMIVANVGGFSMDEPMDENTKIERYEIFAESLLKLELSGVELIPQTMAPFPWHFGGQRYQNLFVHSEEIIKWTEALNLRMCLDISHSSLMSNYFGCDFYEFIRDVAPLTAHIHMGDAKGINGEGLQIGNGNIDFARLCEILNLHCPEASFIPEIWQGHKNDGEGFWKALEKLDGML